MAKRRRPLLRLLIVIVCVAALVWAVAALGPRQVLDAALRLPRSALTGAGQAWIVEAGRLQLRDLEIARGEEDTVLVTSGIAAGDSVVMEPLQGVAPGEPADWSMLSDVET